MSKPFSSIGIYKITNPKGNVYIGQSIHLKKRESRYRNGYCKSQTILYRSIIKYGWNNHSFEVLKFFPKDVSQKELDDAEIFFIKFHKDLGCKMLNIRGGGKEGHMSKESITKMLETRGKWNHTEESKLKMRTSQLGKWHHTEEAKLKMSIDRTGRKMSEEVKQNWREAHKRKVELEGKDFLIDMIENHKKIILNFETGVFYKGAAEAAAAFNLSKSTLQKRLSGQRINNTNLKYV